MKVKPNLVGVVWTMVWALVLLSSLVQAGKKTSGDVIVIAGGGGC